MLPRLPTSPPSGFPALDSILPLASSTSAGSRQNQIMLQSSHPPVKSHIHIMIVGSIGPMWSYWTILLCHMPLTVGSIDILLDYYLTAALAGSQNQQYMITQKYTHYQAIMRLERLVPQTHPCIRVPQYQTRFFAMDKNSTERPQSIDGLQYYCFAYYLLCYTVITA